MKRFLLLFLLISFTFPLFADSWTDYTTGITWWYTQSQGKVTLGQGSNNQTAVSKTIKGNIVVPDLIAGYPVVGLAAYAFNGCTQITSLTLPETVKTIGNSAFESCTALTSVNIPSEVSRISNYTFAYCQTLSSITLPDGITEIGECAFKGCTNLSSIIIPSKVTKIGACAFESCASLQDIHISEGVTEIAAQAFYGCKNLLSLAFPFTLVRLADNCMDNSGVKSVSFQGKIPVHAYGWEDVGPDLSGIETVVYPKTYEKEWEIYFYTNPNCAPSAWHCTEDFVNVIVTPTIAGKIPFNRRAIQWGETVSIAAEVSSDDYLFLGWGSNQPGIGGTDPILTFTMPESEVTVVATFLPKALLEGLIDKQIDGRIDGESLLTKEQAMAKAETVIEEKKEAGELFDRAGVEAEVEASIAEKVASKELVTRESIREMALGAPMIEVDGGQAKVGISLRKASALDGAWEEVTPGQAEVEGPRVKVTVDAKDGAAFYKFVVPDGEQSQTK